MSNFAKTICTFLGVTALTLTALWAGAEQTVSAGGGTEPSATTASEGDLRVRDVVQYYADAYGLGREEAASRLAMMERIPLDLETELSAEPTFAGIFIQHEPELRLVAQFAGEKGADRGRELVSKLVRGVWADLVEVRSVAVSSAELHAARVKAEAALMEMNIPFESSTDDMDNSVEIRVTQPVDDLLVETGIELSPYVKIVVVDQLTVPFANLRASHALRTSAGNFNARVVSM